MKKIIYSLLVMSFSIPVFSQNSKEATSTVSPNTNTEALSESKISTQRGLGAKSVAVTNFSAFHEIAGLGNTDSKVHLLIKESGSNYPRIRMIGSASIPPNNRYWDIQGDVFDTGISDDYMLFAYGTSTYPSLALNPFGKVGVGIQTETKNLHVHENNSGTMANIKLTSVNTGSLDGDGLELQILSNTDVLHPNAARVMNKENTQLFLGANNAPVVNITPTGNVGINSFFGGAPTARFQIFHDTENNATKPHINLVTAVDANNGMVKMTNLTASRYFGQYFSLNSATAANNFLSFDYNGTTPILDLKGNGNVEVAGYTKLGSEASAPKIKMKTITSTTSASEGGDSSFPHGLTASKIIDYTVLVEVAGGGVWVKSNHLHFTERQFDTEINSVNIRVYNNPTNSGNILSRPIKVVLTYTE
jgi:hypothetical protein